MKRYPMQLLDQENENILPMHVRKCSVLEVKEPVYACNGNTAEYVTSESGTCHHFVTVKGLNSYETFMPHAF